MVEDSGQIIISWEALEFTPSNRGVSWYWIAGIILIGICVWAVWFKQWTTLAVIVMLTVAIGLMQRMRPRQFQHALTDKGLLTDQRFTPYDRYRSFWVAATPDGPALNLVPNRKFGVALTLQLTPAVVEQVRETLSAHLPQEEIDSEDVVDRIGRYLKF
jgi:hypothetical protein